MIAEDWLIVLALVLIVAAVVYTLSTRPAAANAAAKKPAAEGTSAKAKKAPRAAPERAKVEGPRPGAKPASTRANQDEIPKPITLDAARPPKDDLVRMEYEEDHDIDPTKIGGAAPKRAVYQPPVQRIVHDDEAGADEPTHTELLFLVSAMAQTDKGLRRKRNEDSVLVLESESLFVVADGMGGYRGGELASQLAVTTIGDAFRRKEFEGAPHEGIPAQASELARAMQMANAAILETSKKKPELEGMGTTVCAARFSANKKRVFIGHVGDSRCYRLRNGVLSQMTADHTMAHHGVKGPEAAHLSRAVGIWPTVPIDIVMGVPAAGDVYLLCSDGLTKMLDDTVIATVLRAEEDLKAAVERLVLFANARGGKDNVSVVLVRVVPPDWRPKPSEPLEGSATGEPS
jgi:protein phosphatase